MAVDNIYISKIDETFPRAGQNNDSQGFRDNFANIKLALNYSSEDIEDLQSKAVVKRPIGNSNVVDNDMNWVDITRAQLKSFSETYYDLGPVSDYQEVDYSLGTIQRLQLTQDLAIQFINFPPVGQFGRLKIWFSVLNKRHKVILPESIVYGINNNQIVNGQIVFPDPGDYLLEIGSVDHGGTFWFIDFANLGGSGGRMGATGATGPQGTRGPEGPPGQFGGLTLPYRFRNITADANPGDGYVAFNDEILSDATEMYISDKDVDANLVESFLRTIDDSTNPIKGHFKISRRSADGTFAIFTINSITETPNYFKISCNYIDGQSSFSNTDEIFVTFARTGDVGPIGATGATGPQGIPGTAVYRGATGATGPRGATGAVGPDGPPGATGVQGIPGPMGFQGATGYTGSYGYTGSIGFTGSQGADGLDGAYAAVGYVGSAGIDGYTGSHGATGATGPQGIPGTAVYRGATGATGIRGATGPIGATGPQGFPGGYTGSVGFTGSRGATGYVGSQGESSFTWGPTPPVNPTLGDRWFDSITGCEAVWTGDGSNEQWVEVSASGYHGRPGYTGSQGITGFVGSVGYTGSIGFQGAQGYTGYTGSAGVDGAYAARGYTGSAGSFPTRITVTGTTPQLPADTNEKININGFRGYVLYKVTVLGAPAWIQIYNNDANRIADEQRPHYTPPGTNIGLIAEVTTTQANQTVTLAPAVYGYNDETPVTTNIPIRVTNRSTTPATITVALTLVKIES